MPIGDRIKELRLKKAESLQQVADAIGASKAHIWELESNRSKNPSIDLLQRLAGHFGTNVAYIIEEPTGEESRADQFFRKNSHRMSAVSDEDLKLFEMLLNRISDGKET